LLGWHFTHGKLRYVCAPVFDGWVKTALAKATPGVWHCAHGTPKWFAGGV